jgi:hypothetical protein
MAHRLYVKIWCHTNGFPPFNAATFNLNLKIIAFCWSSVENRLQWEGREVQKSVPPVKENEFVIELPHCLVQLEVRSIQLAARLIQLAGLVI